MLEAYTALSSLGGQPSSDDVINKFLGIEPKKEPEIKHYLVHFFKEHNDRCWKLAENEQMAEATCKILFRPQPRRTLPNTYVFSVIK